MPLSLDSRSLEIFLAVCDTGSMTAAARLMGITQGAVSQQIGRLEAGLELQLIVRERRELRLTPAGLQLRQFARKTVETIAEGERVMKRYRGYSFQSLSVRVMDTLGRVLASTVIETLKGVAERIELNASVTYRHREDLTSGAIDILISAQPFDDAQFEVHPLATAPLVLVAPKDMVDRADVDLDRLSGRLPLIRFARQRWLGRIADEYLSRQLVLIERTVEIDQTALVIDAVRSGQGWALTTPFGLLEATFTPGQLDVLPLPPPAPVRTINLVVKRDRLGDVPALLAKNCRRHLEEEVERRLSGVAEAIMPSIVIHH